MSGISFCCIYYFAISFNVASLAVAIASLIASVAAARVANSSLTQARQVAVRDEREWKQRKWFDLYFKASEAYDFLEYFQQNYSSAASPSWGTDEPMAIDSHIGPMNNVGSCRQLRRRKDKPLWIIGPWPGGF